jgi:hypothetical protein
MNLSGLVSAECEVRHVGKDGKRWFYVGRAVCNFLREEPGRTLDIQIPTLQIRRALMAMDMQLGKQRAARARKRAAKKGTRR